MRCDEVTPELSAWLDGELAPETARALEAHLEGCAPCRAERHRLHLVVSGVKRLERRLAPPGFAEGVLRAIPAAACAALPACAVLEEGDLSAHLDHELDAARETSVVEHLSGCDPCQKDRRDAEAASRAVRALARRAAPAALLLGIGGRLDELETRRAPATSLPPPARAEAKIVELRSDPWWTSLEKLRGLAAAALLLVSLGVSVAFTTPSLSPKHGGQGGADIDDAMRRSGAASVQRPTYGPPELRIDCADRELALRQLAAICGSGALSTPRDLGGDWAVDVEVTPETLASLRRHFRVGTPSTTALRVILHQAR